MPSTDDLTDRLNDLQWRDLQGILRLTLRGDCPFHQWLQACCVERLAGDDPPRFAPESWQTIDVVAATRQAGCLARACRTSGSSRAQRFFAAVLDELLTDLQERRLA